MSDSEDRRTEIALFRYTLILPLIRGQYPPGGKDTLRQQIARRRYDIPYSSRRSVSVTTLARWERIYRERGFDGLKPHPRADRGDCRTISSETLDRAETLYWPYRTVPSNASSLSAPPAPSSASSPSTPPTPSPKSVLPRVPCAANSPAGVLPPPGF